MLNKFLTLKKATDSWIQRTAVAFMVCRNCETWGSPHYEFLLFHLSVSHLLPSRRAEVGGMSATGTGTSPSHPEMCLEQTCRTSGQKCGGSTGSSTSCCEQHSIWHSQLEWYQTLAFITKKSVKLLEVLKYYCLPCPLQTVSHKAKRKKTTGRTHIHKPQAKHLFPHTFYHFQKVHSMDRPVRSNYSTQTLNFFW